MVQGNGKAHRAYQVRRIGQPSRTLGETAPHTQPAPVLQQGEVAMDEGRGRGSGGAGEISLLDQDHPQAAASRIARETRAVQPTADDRQIIVRHTHVLWWESMTPIMLRPGNTATTIRSYVQAP
jgi:hypothetical protein